MAILAYDDVMLREPRLLVPNQVPVGPVKLDANHPLCKELFFAFIYNEAPRLTELKSGRMFAGGTEASAAINSYGKHYSQSDRTLLTGFQPITLAIGQGFTLLTVANPAATTTRYALICQRGGGYVDEIEFRANSNSTGSASSGGLWLVISDTDVNASAYAAGVVDGKYHAFVGRRSSAGLFKIFVDGIDKTTSGATNKTEAIAPANLCIGGLTDTTSIPYSGQRICDFAWGRALSDAEIESVSRDPFQMLIPA